MCVCVLDLDLILIEKLYCKYFTFYESLESNERAKKETQFNTKRLKSVKNCVIKYIFICYVFFPSFCFLVDWCDENFGDFGAFFFKPFGTFFSRIHLLR